MNEYGKTPKHRLLRKLQLQRPRRATNTPNKKIKKKKQIPIKKKKKQKTPDNIKTSEKNQKQT